MNNKTTNKTTKQPTNTHKTPYKKESFQISLTATIIIIAVVMGRIPFLSFSSPYVKFSLSSIVLLLGATLLKPYYTVFMYVAVDLICALLFPTGAFDIRFTLTALLKGLIFAGLVSWPGRNDAHAFDDKHYIARVATAAVITQFGVNLIINTYIISLLIGKGFLAMLPARVIKECTTTVILIASAFAIQKILVKRFQDYDAY
jgi:ECF transporter S component (folate family)